MEIIVQKFGGSSLATVDKIKEVARQIKERWSEEVGIVVIVSAMGDTTDELLSLAHSVSDEPDPRELDMLLNTGEQVSIALLSMALQELGKEAVSFTGAQLNLTTTNSHQKARIIDIDTSRLHQELQRGNIPVVAGYQGVAENDEYTTLGRGGSDTSAVALAAKLEARCEIYTDVDGIYTCDPGILPRARKLDRISYEEMLEMASLGAEVIHPRAVELAQKYEVPLYVGRSCSGYQGTVINGGVDYLEASIVTGLAVSDEDIEITLRNVPGNSKTLAAVFSNLARAEINVDMISQLKDRQGRMHLSFTIAEGDLSQAKEIISQSRQQWDIEEWWYRQDVSKISVVGPGMRSQPGVAARVFALLAEKEIDILLVTTSEIKISWLVPAAQKEKAAALVGEDFGLVADQN